MTIPQLFLLETAASRDQTVSTISTENQATLHYKLLDTTDEALARQILDAQLPRTHPTLLYPLKKYDLKEDGPNVWSIEAQYGRMPGQNRFSSSTDKERVQLALSAGNDYPRNNETPFRRDRLIGISDDRVEGVDIYAKKSSFTIRKTFPIGEVTTAYLRTIEELTACVNVTAFKGRDICEVLFLGAEGTWCDWDQYVTFEYNFAVSPSRNIWVPGLRRYSAGPPAVWSTDPDPNNAADTDGCLILKLGWEYLWFMWIEERDVVARRLIRKPKAAFVDQVYKYGELSGLNV